MKIMSIFAPVRFEYAQMAELVDALDSKSSAARRAGSIPALGTILGKPFYKSFPNFFSKMFFPVIFQKRYKKRYKKIHILKYFLPK